MKNLLCSLILTFLLLSATTITTLFAQVVTVGPDSTVIRTSADTLAPPKKGLSIPGKAALYSAIIPGGGQVYNKSYWKVPIIYAALGGLGYAIVSNHQTYLRYRQAVIVRRDTIETNDQDEFASRLVGRSTADAISVLSRNRDNFRRYRDYSILYTFLAYGMNITEAYVHAHLKGFDISEELSLQVQPTVMQVAHNSYSPGFSFTLNLKK